MQEKVGKTLLLRVLREPAMARDDRWTYVVSGSAGMAWESKPVDGNQGCNNIGRLCICGDQGFSRVEQAAQMVEFQAYCCRKTYAMEDISPGHEEEMAQMVEFLLLRCMKTYPA